MIEIYQIKNQHISKIINHNIPIDHDFLYFLISFNSIFSSYHPYLNRIIIIYYNNLFIISLILKIIIWEYIN